MNIKSGVKPIPALSKQSNTAQVQQPKVEKVKVQKKVSPKVEIDVFEHVKEEPEYNPTIAEQTVIKAIQHANKKLQGIQTEFEYSIHEKTKQIMVKVLDKETKEVIREIPSEKILDMVSKMWELAGVFVDEKR